MAFHADRTALRPQPRAVARGARLQRAVRFESFLIGPRTFFKPAPQIRDDAFEVRAERIVTFLHARSVSVAPARRAEEHDVPQLLRQLAERRLRIDAERLL